MGVAEVKLSKEVDSHLSFPKGHRAGMKEGEDGVKEGHALLVKDNLKFQELPVGQGESDLGMVALLTVVKNNF